MATGKDLTELYADSIIKGQGVNPLQGFGAGLSGFAAPFLGQTWTNPYAQKTGALDIKDLLLLQALQGNGSLGKLPTRGDNPTNPSNDNSLPTIGGNGLKNPDGTSSQNNSDPLGSSLFASGMANSFSPSQIGSMLGGSTSAVAPPLSQQQGIGQSPVAQGNMSPQLKAPEQQNFLSNINTLGKSPDFREDFDPSGLVSTKNYTPQAAFNYETEQKIRNAKIDLAQFQAQKTMETAAKGKEEYSKTLSEVNKPLASNIAQRDLMVGAFQDMGKLWDIAEKGGLAGNKYKEVYGKLINDGWVDEKWAEKMGVSNDSIQSVAGFISSRNEILTRMIPSLSAQFGKEGSSRILDSVLKLAEKELPTLASGRNAFIGRTTQTVRTLDRFARASAAYAKRVGMSEKDFANMTPEAMDKFVNTVWKETDSLRDDAADRNLGEQIGFATRYVRARGDAKEGNQISQSVAPSGTTHFNVNGDNYFVPNDRVDAFKKAKGLK